MAAKQKIVLTEREEEQRRYIRELEEKNATQAKMIEQLTDRPDFIAVCLRQEWYIANGIRNHISNLQRVVDEAKQTLVKLDADAAANPERFTGVFSIERIKESNQSMIWELERHIKDYTTAKQDLAKVMRIW